MLESPKAHTPKRKDETSLNVKVTKVEKSCEILIRINPKLKQSTGNQQPSPEQGKVQRPFRKEVGGKFLRSGDYPFWIKIWSVLV